MSKRGRDGVSVEGAWGYQEHREPREPWDSERKTLDMALESL